MAKAMENPSNRANGDVYWLCTKCAVRHSFQNAEHNQHRNPAICPTDPRGEMNRASVPIRNRTADIRIG